MLTTKQKCELRSLAQTIKPVFQIGKKVLLKIWQEIFLHI